MDYIGEHLFPGQLGHFLIVLSLVASLVATIAYFKSANAVLEEAVQSWRRIARIAFVIDAVSVTATFGIIYYLISNHYFEYYYAWNHSDKSLSTGYLLASIWEGQEGSFLLWAFWHGILGMLLMRTSKKWEAPVMTVISFAQLYMATMVLGIHFFDIKLGSSPFLLTRYMQPSLMEMANYLTLPVLQDGNGLNQLLQNYWMQIHPPILFLGYASFIVPFAYAVAALWKKEHSTWTKQVMPWALFAVAVHGLGIMMGARWAYESLNFGGYWAWDPVENASMVPWLVLVAGIHTMLIYNSTGHSLRSTYLFYSQLSADPVFKLPYKKRRSGRYFRSCIYQPGTQLAVKDRGSAFCDTFFAFLRKTIQEYTFHCQRRKYLFARILDVYRVFDFISLCAVHHNIYFASCHQQNFQHKFQCRYRC